MKQDGCSAFGSCASSLSVIFQPTRRARASGSISQTAPQSQTTRTRKSPKQSSSFLMWGRTRTREWCGGVRLVRPCSGDERSGLYGEGRLLGGGFSLHPGLEFRCLGRTLTDAQRAPTMKRTLSHLAIATSPALAMACLLMTGNPGLAVAGDVPPEVTVILDVAGLEQLRTTNPDHYARAQRILAAGTSLCWPAVRGVEAKVELAKLRARDVSCDSLLLLTSLPPKRLMHFRLDDTNYEAYLTGAVVKIKPHRVDPQRVEPAR